MQTEIVNKFGIETIKNFWVFIESLKFNPLDQDSSVVRGSLLKKLSPSIAGKYKEIADQLAFSLYRGVCYDKNSSYLYASFNCVSKGLNYYEECWENSEKIEELVKTVDQFNNFSSCLPTEDDYFNFILPSPESILEEYEEYDTIQSSNGIEKGKNQENFLGLFRVLRWKEKEKNILPKNRQKSIAYFKV